MADNIRIPNSFSVLENKSGLSSIPVYIYCLVDTLGEVRYIGSTNDLIQTKNRHRCKEDLVGCYLEFVIWGMFYDRSIAEYVEIKLIEEYVRQGAHLLNKVVGHKIC